MLPMGALRISIEEKYGALPYFFLYALLEWLLIILLFLDGFLAFLSYEIARLFELETPCLLCTRLDHVLVQRSSTFYYNESMCEGHKRDISTLTYCHVHARLSDIRSMCKRCLLASDNSAERHLELKQLRKHEVETVANERIGIMRCSCCGELLRSKSASRHKASLSVAMPASPRAAWFSDEGDLQNSRYTELKLIAATGAGLHGDQDAPLVDRHGMNHMAEDEPRTPHFSDRNRFFGISLADDGAAPGSPKRLDLAMEEEGDQGDIVARLKRQVTLDRRSLTALYVELDEERSASAIAANNAMAMITRLQEEKAAVQMEALQYQRMMEEQAEYDQEAMQMMKDMLVKREGEIKALEYELDGYRARYGASGDLSNDLCEVDLDEGYQDVANSEVVSSSDSQKEDQLGIQDDVANSGAVSLSDSQKEDELRIQDDVANSGEVSLSDSQKEDELGIQDAVSNLGVVSLSDSLKEDELVIQDDAANSGVVSLSDSQKDDERRIQDDVSNMGVVSLSDSQKEDERMIQDDVANPRVVSLSDSQKEEERRIQDNIANSGVVSSSDSQKEDERRIQDELSKLDYEGEMCNLLGQLRELEEKMFAASDETPTSRAGDEERLAGQVTLVKARLRAVEAESIFLKNIAMSLHKKGEGVKVLSEISQHLRKQRQKHDVY